MTYGYFDNVSIKEIESYTQRDEVRHVVYDLPTDKSYLYIDGILDGETSHLHDAADGHIDNIAIIGYPDTVDSVSEIMLEDNKAFTAAEVLADYNSL